MENTNKRRFSLEENFMNFSTDDLLYGFMQYLSTYHPIEKKLYLTKKKFQENKAIINDICGFKSRNTLNNHIKKLIETGLIAEQDIKNNYKEYPSYVFPYDELENYQLINQDMLWYVISTRNQQAVKIYVYLLNKYLWKPDYSFTIRELQQVLGYSETTKTAASLISNILKSFKREGIIDYTEEAITVISNSGREVDTTHKVLKFVAQKENELRAV